jgi:hypothetical protein
MVEKNIKIELSVLDTGKVRSIISLNNLFPDPGFQGISQSFLKVYMMYEANYFVLKLTYTSLNYRINCFIRFLKRTHCRLGQV